MAGLWLGIGRGGQAANLGALIAVEKLER